MNTTTRILTVLAACLFATQAQAMQIKGKSYNAVKSIKSSKLIPGLTSVDLTKFVLGSKSYVSPKGNKQTIPGGYPKLDKNKVKKWQEESLAQGDVGDMAAARKAEVIKDRHRSFLQLRGATAEQRPQPEEAHDPWIAFDLTPEKTHTKQRPQIDIEQP